MQKRSRGLGGAASARPLQSLMRQQSLAGVTQCLWPVHPACRHAVLHACSHTLLQLADCYSRSCNANTLAHLHCIKLLVKGAWVSY